MRRERESDMAAGVTSRAQISLQMDDPSELDAFFHFFATFALSRPVASPADLSDGAALSDVLAIVFVSFLSCLRSFISSPCT